MMNKKGTVVLRDVVFMMMIVSAIFVLAGLFVEDMANNYDNTNMSNEWAATGTSVIGNSTFFSVGDNVTDVGGDLSTESTGIYSLISGVANSLKGLGKGVFMVITAPNTIADLLSAVLQDVGVDSGIANIIKYLVAIILWIIVIFTIYSAFLRGPKL